VMEAFAALPDAAERATTFLEPEDVRAVNPAVQGEVAGALHCTQDGAVEPRRAADALRADLERRVPDRYAFHTARRVVALAPGAVVDTRGTRWEGDLVVVATGAAYDQLPETAPFAPTLRRVRLQMVETSPFAGDLTTSLADADSLRYYPAYEAAPLDRLPAQNAVASAHRLQLLLVQRLDGGLTIGDTHA
jgi:glycine/D-amino acid oxidase-like deaminating enzyme